MLYVIATPIGNLADISVRAIETLKSVDYILTENRRHSKILFDTYQITTRMQSFHEHNEKKKTPKIIDALIQGVHFALVSDAGTPLISDPGYILVNMAKIKNIKVIPIPGASAFISALSASGIASDKFSFMGFLPSKKTQRLKYLDTYAHRQETLIFYESPKRIMASLQDMVSVFGTERPACLAKEITKHFEAIYTKTLAEIIIWLEADKRRVCGEFVLIISGDRAKKDFIKYTELDKILSVLLPELSITKVAKIAAKLTGLDKKNCYQYALKKQKQLRIFE